MGHGVVVGDGGAVDGGGGAGAAVLPGILEGAGQQQWQVPNLLRWIGLVPQGGALALGRRRGGLQESMAFAPARLLASRA